MRYSDWRQLVSLGEGDEFRIQCPRSASAPEATVRLPLRLVAWLNEAIQEGATLTAPREAGGVLVGAISRASKSFNGSAMDVSVELFLPIACSDSEGSLYRLSEEDKETMREQLKGVGVSSMVVGLYRTNLRPSLELDQADEALADELLTFPGCFFLILAPDATDGPQATLFLRGADSICLEPSLTFPFDYAQLSELRAPHAAVRPELPAQIAKSAEPAEPAEPVDYARPAVLPPSPARRKWVWAVGIAALLVLAFAGVRSWLARRPAAVTGAAPVTDVRSGIFNLKAAREQDHLRITWDPRALPLDARTGALVITDGEVKTQIAMDASAVSQGSVEYYPRSGFLRLELRIANLSDMVMVAGLNAAYAAGSPSAVTPNAKSQAPRGKAYLPPQLASSPRGPSQTARAEPSASQTARASQAPASQPAQPPVSQPAAASESRPSDSAPAGKQFQPPRTDPLPSTPVLAAAPALSQAASPSGSLPQTAAPGFNPPSSAAGAKSTPTPAQPAPAKPAGLSTPSVRVASPPANAPADFVAAQVKERVLPTISASVLRLVSPAVVVHVRVQIDTQGKVVKAESLTHGPALVDTLADAAVEAARRWQFVPARLANENIASDTVLNFTFTSGN